MTQLRCELETATRYMDEGAAILAELAFNEAALISVLAYEAAASSPSVLLSRFPGCPQRGIKTKVRTFAA
jgi:hypothetical protein